MDSTTICNLALAKIGDLSILSLEDPTPEARFSKLFYQPTLQALLRLREWQFAIRFVQLSPISPNPTIGWAKAYGLPSDFSRIVSLNVFDDFTNSAPYEVNGNKLYTDEATAFIRYISNAPDPNDFDDIFIELLTTKIAAKLARPLAGSLDITKDLNEDYNNLLKAAESIGEKDYALRRNTLVAEPYTATSICNMALLKITDIQINSITADSPVARLCNLLYEPTIKALLRSYDWNFARKQATLTASATNPTFNWARQYPLPADFGRLIDLNQFDDFSSKPPYEIQGGMLLTNEITANIVYTTIDVAETLFTHEFVQVLVATLGSKLVVPLKADMGLIQVCLAEATAMMNVLQNSDVSEQNTRRATLLGTNYDPTRVCNMALAKIGTDTISAIDNGTPVANLCNLVFSEIVNQVLRYHPWSFATTFASLVASTATNPTTWEKAFVLPTNFLRLLSFNKYEENDSTPAYEIVGNLLYTNETDVTLKYIKAYNAADIATWETLFRELVVLKLAIELLTPTKGDKNLLIVLQREFSAKMAEARRIGAEENTNNRVPLDYLNSRLISSRYNGVV